MSDKTTTSRAYGFQGQLMPVYLTIQAKYEGVMRVEDCRATELPPDSFFSVDSCIDVRSNVDLSLESEPQSGTDKE